MLPTKGSDIPGEVTGGVKIDPFLPEKRGLAAFFDNTGRGGEEGGPACGTGRRGHRNPMQ
jgi:hypothetical protein